MKLFLLFTIFLAGCSSGPKTFTDRPLPRAAVVRSAVQGVIASRVKPGPGGKSVFIIWRYAGADSDNLRIQYEEHFESVKAQADLREVREFPVDSSTVTLGDLRMTIYIVRSDQIVYQMDFTREK